MVCGFDNLMWQDFRKAILCLYLKQYHPFIPSDQFAYRDKAMRLARHQTGVDIQDLFQLTKDAGCSDPRDRVFALLSLLGRGDKCPIQPDYTKSVEDVYREVFVWEVEKTRLVDGLRNCELALEGLRTSNLPSWIPDLSIPRRSEELKLRPFDWSSLGNIPAMDEDILNVRGVTVAKVKAVYNHTVSSGLTTRDIVLQLHDIFDEAGFDMNAPFIRGGDFLEAYSRTVVANRFSETQVPENTNYPSRVLTFETMRRALNDRGPIQYDSANSRADFERYIDTVLSAIIGRAVFSTEEGYIGIGPTNGQAGDCVTTLIGCRSPMILRPQETGQWLVVGEAYCQGIMDGEPFLGPLPEGFEAMTNKTPANGFNYPLFLNRDTGESLIEDPRLGELPRGWIRAHHPAEELFTLFDNFETGAEMPPNWDPRTTPEALEERGTVLKDFELV
jgi:hypothetical protein